MPCFAPLGSDTGVPSGRSVNFWMTALAILGFGGSSSLWIVVAGSGPCLCRGRRNCTVTLLSDVSQLMSQHTLPAFGFGCKLVLAEDDVGAERECFCIQRAC